MATTAGNPSQLRPLLSGGPQGSNFKPLERRIVIAVVAAIAVWGSVGVDYDARFDNGVKPDPVVRRTGPTGAAVVPGAPPPILVRHEDVVDPAVQRGAELFAANGCIACHSIDGSTRIGPSLSGIWGTEQSLTDGSTAYVDAAYVEESILLPQAREVTGYDAQMPSYEGLVGEAEIAALTAYVRSLK